jgi:hypothetical protein
MKKLISLFLAMALCLSLAACAAKAPDKDTTTSQDTTASEETTEETTDETMPDVTEDEAEEAPEGDTTDTDTEEPPIDQPAANTPDPDAGASTGSTPSVSKPDGNTSASKPDSNTSASKPEGAATIDAMPLADAMTSIVDASKTDFGSFFSSYDLAAADAGYAIGYDSFAGSFEEALAFGPSIGSTAFILVLFRLADGQDAAAFADDIRANANPAKWICVQADYVDAEANGQTVLFLMSSLEACPEEARTAMLQAFRGL